MGWTHQKIEKETLEIQKGYPPKIRKETQPQFQKLSKNIE